MTPLRIALSMLAAAVVGAAGGLCWASHVAGQVEQYEDDLS